MVNGSNGVNRDLGQMEKQAIDQAMAAKYRGEPKVVCVNPDCDSELFTGCAQIHKVSQFISATGQQTYFTVQRTACLKCHTLLPLQP